MIKSKLKITVALYGGLGNQLFQYSFGRMLAKKYGVSLCLDLHGFKYDKFYGREFELLNFGVDKNISYASSCIKFHFSRFLSKTPLFVRRVLYKFFLTENKGKFNLFFLKKKIDCNLYIYGYWQDENYFSEIREVLLRDFLPKNSLTSKNAKLLKDIVSETDSVSMHVRRMHGIGRESENIESSYSLDLNYYRKAADYIKRSFPSAKFYVFSDNPEWAKENLDFVPDAIFLDDNRGPDFEDLLLMKECRHHVIANSSFSWWGAWLANNPDQVVIAPPPSKYCPTIPERWIRL